MKKRLASNNNNI
jgi:hypothetical protein